MSRVAGYRQKNPRNRRSVAVLLWLIIIGTVTGTIFYFSTFFYQKTKNDFEEVNYPREYSEFVEKASKKYDLEPALIYALIRTESSFNPDAESEVGACGLMQIMPSSFEWLQDKRDESGKYTTQDLFNPEICIDYGCYLLRYFYDLYGTEQCAVAAYNAGFVVGEWLSDSKYSADGKTLSNIPYPETSNYVEKVKTAKEMYIKLYYS